MAEEVQQEQRDPREVMRENFDAGQSIRRADGQSVIGEGLNIAWWDEVALGGVDRPELEAGQMVKAELSALSGGEWSFHCKDRDHGAHGLKLAAQPAVVALAKRPSGNIVALIGYCAAV